MCVCVLERGDVLCACAVKGVGEERMCLCLRVGLCCGGGRRGGVCLRVSLWGFEVHMTVGR